MRFHRIFVPCFLAFAALFVFPASLLSQHTSAGVNGTVTDNSGGVIPGAAVTLTNRDTNIVSHATTNGSGYFVFPDVAPGNYSLSITKQGFRTVELPSMTLEVNQFVTENEVMPVGAVNETVKVDAEQLGAMLQNSSSELGSVIQTKEIQQLPLNGRNFTSLLILSPGVTPVSTAQGSGISTTDAGITAIPNTAFYKVSFFGQQNRETLYYMDGIVNTDLRGAIYGFLPIIDAMQEFKVQSHIDSAEFGVVTGGIVNMLSKSGSNKFHGSVWEFIRNNDFDARNSYSDFCNSLRCGAGSSVTTPAGPLHYDQNQFGAALGGPIFRNKLFFYGAYEGWRFSKPGLSQTLVPTTAELGGDFTNSYYSGTSGHQIYNPYSTVCTGGKCTVQQFQCDGAGNPITPVNGVQAAGTPCLKIPSSMLNPAMTAYMKAYYQAPNSLANEASGFNYVDIHPQIDNSNAYQVRIDYHKSEKNFFFGRVSMMWVYDSQPIVGTFESNVSRYHAYNFGGAYTHVFSPSLLLEIRGGAMLKPYVFDQAFSPNGFAAATQAGFQNVSQYGGMYINLGSPYATTNAGSAPNFYRGNPVINGGGSVTFLRGTHTMKAGLDYIYQNRLQRNLYQQFTFSDSVTSNIGAVGTNKVASGNSLASAVLGLPATFTAQTPDLAEDYFNMQLWSGYVQDSWKARPNLTVNFGLRYEYVPAIQMLDGRLANSFDIPNGIYTISAASVPACTTPFSDPCIPGGIGSVPNSDHIRFSPGQKVGPPVSDNIAPRLGFAYQWGQHTVINGGAGMFYDTITARSQWVQNNIEGPTWPWTTGISNQQTNFAQNGYWPGAPQNPVTPITSLEGNFPSPVVAASPWLTTGGGYVTQPDYKDQRSVEWNLQVQQQLAAATLVSVGYAGSKSTRLDFTGFANTAQHASPAGTALTTIDTFKYLPFVSPGWHYSTDNGYGNYNALLMEFQKRFSNFNTIASYTWSKSLDNSSGWFAAENGTGGGSVVQSFFMPRNAYGTSSYDIKHYFSWSTVYSLPFGRGQRWLQKGVAAYLAGGWKANYLFQIRSGQPYNLNVGGDPANISGDNGSVASYSRPNTVAGVDPGQGSCGSTPVGQRGASGFCMFNPAAFTTPVGSFGNAPKMGYRLPSYNNLDFSVVKETPLLEGASLELRAESFNTYNVVIPGTPGTTIGNSTAGLVTGQGNTPRELQFGAKIIF